MKTANILEAVGNYDMYSKNQKKILKALVAVSLDGVACIGVTALSKATNIAPNSIYVTLRKLESDNCITRVRQPGQTTNTYRISMDKIQEIIKVYEAKKSGLIKIKE